jgi:hypothetical protein
MSASFSSAAVGHLLYPPSIVRSARFWITLRGWIFVWEAVLPLSCIPHISEPYVIVGRTIPVYSSRERFVEGPHVDAVIRYIAASITLLLLTDSLICFVQLSLESTQIPRTFIAGSACLSC